jgi:hypothetical protein
MASRKERIEAFFRAYAKRSDDALKDPPKEDVDGMVAAFAPFFVGSGPKGVMGGANDATFREMIPQGNARYRDVGGKAFKVTNVELTELDDDNVMATVGWDFAYERRTDGKKGNIAFTNRYFLNTAGEAPKIFAFITPDEEQAMKEHGLI